MFVGVDGTAGETLFVGVDGTAGETLFVGVDGTAGETLFVGVDGTAGETLFVGVDGTAGETLFVGVDGTAGETVPVPLDGWDDPPLVDEDALYGAVAACVEPPWPTISAPAMTAMTRARPATIPTTSFRRRMGFVGATVPAVVLMRS
ncbi:hypothetical protein [Gordonia otitidis]|uniref:Uncharacterized protein n=1 Tax=Gordonia otitidis (strain DSM 44809 / CCUG 52243 / JCM 12355 / NBRC 100426 / IFM 10032) TaxID=1108044 RepID=H5TQV9_GORO1|nr:hypothetical protein [Gordonia otitidis]GAB35867.1 hypothetical protein GOOTI_187_00020 [Gordonia otitidis NBRC 100426]